jgi:hypothetical protein
MPRSLYAPPSEGPNALENYSTLRSDTLSRLEHYRSIAWIPPNYKPKTQKLMAVFERYWYKYALHREDYYCKH